MSEPTEQKYIYLRVISSMSGFPIGTVLRADGVRGEHYVFTESISKVNPVQGEVLLPVFWFKVILDTENVLDTHDKFNTLVDGLKADTKAAHDAANAAQKSADNAAKSAKAANDGLVQTNKSLEETDKAVATNTQGLAALNKKVDELDLSGGGGTPSVGYTVAANGETKPLEEIDSFFNQIKYSGEPVKVPTVWWYVAEASEANPIGTNQRDIYITAVPMGKGQVISWTGLSPSAAGYGNYIWKTEKFYVEPEENAVQIDGIADPMCIRHDHSLAGDGSNARELFVQLSEKENNALILEEDGLFVAPSSGGAGTFGNLNISNMNPGTYNLSGVAITVEQPEDAANIIVKFSYAKAGRTGQAIREKWEDTATPPSTTYETRVNTALTANATMVKAKYSIVKVQFMASDGFKTITIFKDANATSMQAYAQ